METELPEGFVGMLTTATSTQKKAMLKLLSESIAADELNLGVVAVYSSESVNSTAAVNGEVSAVTHLPPPPPPNRDPAYLKTLAEHVEDIGIHETLSDSIISEFHSLNLTGDRLKTQWLSPTRESYNYAAVVNHPKQIKEFPAICKLMELVNDHPSTTGDLDSALVTRYPKASVYLGMHRDQENLISQQSSIATVSFGATRWLRVVLDGKVHANGNPDNRADLLLPKLHNTMNVMKPGSQAIMRHGVVKGHQTDAPNDVSECWSISFRKIVQVPSPEDAPLLSIEHQRDSPVTSKKTVVLVAGDSFAARLDAGLLGKGKQDVRNIATGGRKIEQCQKDIETFIQQHPDVQVKKLFVSIGTNDIRNCKNGITHLKQPLSNLMKSIRLNLPDAKVWFQNLPPIHPNGCKFTVKNVLNMNKMIFFTCSRYKIFYMDAFNVFLDVNGNRNQYLFPKYDSTRKMFDIHPNKRGLGVLARVYIYSIHSKWFNPMGY